jgi:betaine-aldehyde dehydrogenase
VTSPTVQWRGVKQSGIDREECFAELLEFTYTKNVNLKLQ